MTGPRRHLLRILRRRDERGSLIVVMTVIIIVVMLSTLLFVRVVGNQQIIIGRQSAYAGVSGADAGLSDALFRLDQGSTDAPNTGIMCLNGRNPADPNCTVTATPELSGVSYVARTVPAGTTPAEASQWVVQALGNAQTGERGAVQETLNRTSLYPFALFGKKSLSFTGNTTSGDFASYSPGAPGVGTFTPCSNTNPTPACVAIGTDGSISCSGPSPLSVQGVFYNNGSGGGDSCGTPQPENTNYALPDPVPPANPGACPNNGMLGAGNGVPTLDPGVYLCTTPVTINGNLQDTSTTYPVQLYVMLPSGSNTSSTTFLNMSNAPSVNTTLTATQINSSDFPQDYTMPDAQMFQIFTNSVGNLDTNGVSNSFVYAGIIYAPDASMTANGCKNYYFGSAIINTYTCHGGPNLGFYYDSSLQYDFGGWQVGSYQQINPSAVSIP